MDPQRRFFLRGRVATPAPVRPPRPPWAVAEADFLVRCTRCTQCISTCPEQVLHAGDGGYPEVQFDQRGCTLCGDCVRACPSAALQRQPEAPAWTWQPQISPACLAQRRVECRVCGEACDHRALRFRPTLGNVPQPMLDTAACTGCGACVAPCPTRAIQLQEPRHDLVR